MPTYNYIVIVQKLIIAASRGDLLKIKAWITACKKPPVARGLFFTCSVLKGLDIGFL